MLEGDKIVDTKTTASTTSLDQIKETLANYILKDFLPGSRRSELQDTTPLITGGILNSLSTLKLVLFLEEQFNIQIEGSEVNVDNLNTLTSIANLVQSKL